jgi:NitT/TauT family transport system substrate-binding protein
MTVTLIENFRAVFYTPFYAPIALGTYEAEGVDVRIVTSTTMARTIHALIDGEGEVSWGGLSRLMNGMHSNPGRRPVAFCELIARDPFFLLGRTPNPRFSFADLLGRRVATVSEVPAPWMCLSHDLRLAGIDPASVTRSPERTMAENAAALVAGNVDVIQVFQPHVHQLVSSGAAHVWCAAANRGLASYTTLNTTRDFAGARADTLHRMARAVLRAQQWIWRNDSRELARAVASFFPDLPPETLEASFDGYKALGVWSRNPLVSRPGFEWIRDAAVADGRVRQHFTYEDCVDTRFATTAMSALAGN